MSSKEELQLVKQQHHELCLDLNLDQTTADEVWESYSKLKLSYTLEGDQLLWLACTLYASCRSKCIPTVGGRPGNIVQGNGVSLTRVLQHCKVSLTDFIRKMKLWLAMSHCDQDFCKQVELLERNFAVSNNIFNKYKPIFLSLFKDPAQDLPRPPRSRKQRRPPCNATELFHFCWALYILIKGRYPSIPQDLVSCYCLLLASIDLIYANVVKSGRENLLNFEAEPNKSVLSDGNSTKESKSIIDYLCKKFEGVIVDTKVVKEYYWKPNIKDMVDKGVLKGTVEGYDFLEQNNFDHNVKAIKKAYEEHLLNCGDFDERMFLSDDTLLKTNSPKLSPQISQLVMKSPVSSGLLGSKMSLMQEGDKHLMPQTPISGKLCVTNRPTMSKNPLTAATVGLQNLQSLVFRKNYQPKEELSKIFSTLKNNPESLIKELVDNMSENLRKCYGDTTSEYSGLNPELIKMRVHFAQILYYTFMTHILGDEIKRGVDPEAVLHQEIFHKTLFTCCIELVLKAYNDARQFPWSLQVAELKPYYFFRIIEIVIRVEKKCENYELSRELVKHLKVVEELILDSLSWQSDSPLWDIIRKEPKGVPRCADVNYPYNLVNEKKIVANDQAGSTLMSPTVRPVDRSVSPVSHIISIPGVQDSPRRMLFPSDTLKRAETKKVRPSSAVTKLAHHGIDQSTNVTIVSPVSGTVNDKPRRSGSLAIFFRKFYTLAHMRLIDLCDRLRLEDEVVRLKIWTCFEYSVTKFTHLMLDRHMDQMIMCAVYITLKVTATEPNFQEIMKHYRSQPQASSHIYRSVLISRNHKPSPPVSQRSGPPPTPSQVTGTSSNLPSGERGDLIKFYNKVYVQELKSFAQTLSANTRGSPAILSPTPNVRRTPVSPRKRVSENHKVYINTLPSNSQVGKDSPTMPLPYFFNRSPAKDLRVINTVISSPRKNGGGEPDRKRIKTEGVIKSILFQDGPNEVDNKSQS